MECLIKLLIILLITVTAVNTDQRTRYVARVLYDGAGFRGWQEQEHKVRTVQGTLSRTITKRFGMNIRCTGASRTDQGVHAKGQCIHFDVPQDNLITDVEFFEHSFNRMLPGDIRIYNLTIAPPGNPQQILANKPFHATTSTNGKLYIYRFRTGDFVEPWQRQYCTHFYRNMDMDIFRKALSMCVGTHDFTAFANKIEKTTQRYEELELKLRTERTIHSIALVEEGNGYYRIEFQLISAMYRMVRNIVGTALFTAEGMMTLSEFKRLLTDAPCRNENLAKSAPPEGLWLEHVYYDHY